MPLLASFTHFIKVSHSSKACDHKHDDVSHMAQELAVPVRYS